MAQKPILAICYDFDKTLSPEDMQAQGYIQSIKYDVDDFWKESNDLAAKNDMDQNLAYMYMMSNKARGKVVFTKEILREYGAKVKLFPGVKTWFDRINNYGAGQGVIVEHYIISSGLKEMIEGTKVADKFKKIYASSFYYDKAGVAVWPAQAVNYTNKTQFLFRIEKGILDVNDQRVNDYFEPDKYRIPFRNIVYIGDSDTDIPCMKLVNVNGGHSIGVYNDETQDKSKVFKMLEENRIKYFAPAVYTENSKLESLIKQIIDRTISNEILQNYSFNCISERLEEIKNLSEEEQYKENIINKLEGSMSFSSTHNIISELSTIIDMLTKSDKIKLLKIAMENSQVKYILNDYDLKRFFEKICQGVDDENAVKVREMFK